MAKISQPGNLTFQIFFKVNFRARQLIYLARAILAKPKILLIDELSFDLDADNWGLIQEILRTQFKETTIMQVCTS
jgi:ABC-type multidrug transport system ATPase subunit